MMVATEAQTIAEGVCKKWFFIDPSAAGSAKDDLREVKKINYILATWKKRATVKSLANTRKITRAGDGKKDRQ